MNYADKEYHRLLRRVIDDGKVKKNRTGIDTIGVFGEQARFDLSQGFPLLTTKLVNIKAIVHELLWFISGSNNIAYLVKNGVNIWNGNCFDRYQKLRLRDGVIAVPDLYLLTDAERMAVNSQDPELAFLKADAKRKEQQFINRIKGDPEFAATWGALGEGTYGGMWRDFPYAHPYMDDNREEVFENHRKDGVDQLAKVIDKLKNSPDDRRIIVSAWHPYWVDHCALPPCHVMFHFNTEELEEEERQAIFYKRFPNFSGHEDLKSAMEFQSIPKRKLNCLLYQRSCDLFLGVPFNIASYALLTQLVAHCVNMVPGEFIHTYGDLHLYSNTIEQAKIQLSRSAFALPTVEINSFEKDLFNINFGDISLKNYMCHPALKADMAV